MLEERPLLLAAAALYFGATATGLVAIRGKPAGALAVGLLGAALLAHAASIALRWERLGHGPFVNLYEILSSNVWSLHAAAFAAACASLLARKSLGFILIALQVLTLWLIVTPPVDSALPVTYHSPWLPVHVTLGKIFLSLVVIAVGFSAVVLARRLFRVNLASLPASAVVEEAAYRLMLVAVIFESLMLVAGAAWAQDAWGRYWAWDPLEVWAFATWTLVVAYLHWRASRKPKAEHSALAIMAIFAIAFLTFFGAPFISEAPHKGAI